MKLKKIVKCSLATALIFGSVGALAGCKKDNETAEKTEQEKTYDLYVQYMSAKGDTPLTYEQWLASIKGEKGDPGDDAIAPKVRINETTNEWEISTDNGVTWTSTGVKATGTNGNTPEITVGQNGNWFVDGTDTTVKAQGDKGADAVAPKVRINQTTNEWEISTDDGDTWVSTGVKATGNNGQDLVEKEVLVTYDFNLGRIDLVEEILNNGLFNCEGFEIRDISYENYNLTFKMSQKVKKGSYFDLYDCFEEMGIGEYFDGWYVNDTKVNELNVVADNIELTAKWKKDFNEFVDSNRYDNSYFLYDSDNTAFAYPTTASATLYLKDFVARNGKLYKVTDFSIYKDGKSANIGPDDEIYARVVYLSDSLAERCFTGTNRFLNFNYQYNGAVSYYTNNHYYDEEHGFDVYTTKDIAIVTWGNEGNTYPLVVNARMHYIYEIDYENNTATLIDSNRHASFSDTTDNDKNILGEIPLQFNTIINGENKTITVTEIDTWYTPEEHIEYDVENPQNGYLVFVVGKLEGQVLKITNNFMRLSLGLTNEEIMSVKIALFLEGSASDYEIVEENFVHYETIYYYSEEEPKEEGNYWHYSDLSERSPVIWENN